MEMQDFEKKLIQMTKPEVKDLKHEEMLSDALSKAKDKSVVSWWWLSVPLYIIAAFMMKSMYNPHSSLISDIHDLTNKERALSVLFFLILPIVFILINILSIRRIHILSGSPTSFKFLGTVWYNVLIIFFSILVILIYTL
jgi:magnesium-transporting ATPase (P-type)